MLAPHEQNQDVHDRNSYDKIKFYKNFKFKQYITFIIE